MIIGFKLMLHTDFTGQTPTQTPSKQQGSNGFKGLSARRPPPFRQSDNALPFPPFNQRLQVSNEPQEQLLSALSQNRGQNPPQFAKGGNVRRPAPFDVSRQNLRRF